jgi:inner membrane protein involved in colicin E2 resistance
MDLITEPDIYSPSMDDLGNYIDKVPSFLMMTNGIRCPCGSRKDFIYNTRATFANHIKTKMHLKWLADVNCNKSNYMSENEKLKETINNQRLIISKMEKELHSKILTIDYLTQQLHSQGLIKPSQSLNTVTNLLDFD